MGFRNKIAILSKERHEIIKDMTYSELKEWAMQNKIDTNEDAGGIAPYGLVEELYCLGKECEFSLEKFKQPIFSNKKTNSHFNDGDQELFIIGAEGFIHIIEHYRAEVLEHLKGLLKTDEERDGHPYLTRYDSPENYVKSLIQEWEDVPYDLRPNTEEVVSSWRYEFMIFELVRILKTIDQSKYLICLTGW